MVYIYNLVLTSESNQFIPLNYNRLWAREQTLGCRFYSFEKHLYHPGYIYLPRFHSHYHVCSGSRLARPTCHGLWQEATISRPGNVSWPPTWKQGRSGTSCRATFKRLDCLFKYAKPITADTTNDGLGAVYGEGKCLRCLKGYDPFHLYTRLWVRLMPLESGRQSSVGVLL